MKTSQKDAQLRHLKALKWQRLSSEWLCQCSTPSAWYWHWYLRDAYCVYPCINSRCTLVLFMGTVLAHLLIDCIMWSLCFPPHVWNTHLQLPKSSSFTDIPSPRHALDSGWIWNTHKRKPETHLGEWCGAALDVDLPFKPRSWMTRWVKLSTATSWHLAMLT